MFFKISYLYSIKCLPLTNYNLNMEENMIDNKLISCTMNQFKNKMSTQVHSLIFGISNNSVYNTMGMFHNIPIKLLYINENRTYKILYKQMIFNISKQMQQIYQQEQKGKQLLTFLQVDLFNQIKSQLQKLDMYQCELLTYVNNIYQITINPQRLISNMQLIKNTQDNRLYDSNDIQLIDLRKYSQKIKEDSNCKLYQVYKCKSNILY